MRGKLQFGLDSYIEIQAKYLLLRFIGLRPDTGNFDSFLIANCATPGCAAMLQSVEYR